MTERKTVTADTIRDAVTERFIETGESSTVKDIAERLKCSESTVRKVINANHGAVDGTLYDTESRASYSKSYAMFEAGSHRVGVYTPSPKHLRDIIRAMRVEKREPTLPSDKPGAKVGPWENV